MADTKEKISTEMLDELAAQVSSEADLKAVMRQLSKGLIERVLEAEMTEHLSHERGGVVVNPENNTRNGASPKRVKGELGEHHPAFRLPGGHQKGDLYNERYRVTQLQPQEASENKRRVPRRRRAYGSALSSPPKRLEALE